MTVVHIYSLPQVVELTTAYGAPNMNYPVNRTNISIFRKLRNDVDFHLKDIDRKPVVVPTGTVPTIHIINEKFNDVLISRPLTAVNAAKGYWRLSLSSTETEEWTAGYLTYMVTLVPGNGEQQMLYTDRGRTPKGVIEVIEGPIPDPIPSYRIDWDQLLLRNGFYYSSAFPGSASVQNLTGLQSIGVYATSFTGTVTVQGSLEMSPTQDDSQWFDIHAEDITALTSVRFFEVTGNYLWIRFQISVTSGQVDHILFRN